MNVNNNNREDDIKKEDIEIDNVDHGSDIFRLFGSIPI